MAWTRRRSLCGALAVGVVGLAAIAAPPSSRNAGVLPCPKGCFFQGETPTASVTPPLAPVTPPPVCSVCRPEVSVPTTCAPACPLVHIDVPKPVNLELPTLPTLPSVPKVETPLLVQLPAVVQVTPSPDLVPSRPESTPALPPRPVPSTPIAAVVPQFNKVSIDFSAKPMRCEVSSGVASLKLDCDALDVRMPGEAGANTTPLKATGHVRFTAPGCHGYCDELVVYTTTGEVTLHGNVKLRCQQGNVETEVTGTSVKFKLGATTVVSQAR